MLLRFLLMHYDIFGFDNKVIEQKRHTTYKCVILLRRNCSRLLGRWRLLSSLRVADVTW